MGKREIPMQTLERYLTLYRRYAMAGSPGEPAEASLDEVAEALFCTVRNAKLVLRKLAEEGLIVWKAGLGRGNRSSIAFLADREELLEGALRRYVEAGEFNKAFLLMQSFGEGTAASEKLIEWMSGSFGFRQEQEQGTDVLRLPIYGPIMTVDPADYIFSLSSHLIQQLFDRLVEYEESSGRVVPGVAHHWECNEDATAWTFHLRKGVLFHNGSELTAADVAFTAERLKSGGHRNGWIMRSLRRVEAVSPRTVTFHLEKPNWLFPKFACHNAMSLLPSGLAGASEEQFWRHPVGTGPFRTEEWTDERLLLRAHEDYYLSRPHLDRVEMVLMPCERSERSLIGRLSWQQLICVPNLREVSEDNGWIQLESRSLCTSMLSWNMRRAGPQRSAAFRRAVDRLLDRSALVRELGGYRSRPANGFVPGTKEEGAAEAVRTDPEEIRTLLREADYEGAPITLCTYSTHIDDARWIQRQCAEAGVEVRLRIEGADTIHGVIAEADLILHALVLPEVEVGLIESCQQEHSFLKEMLDPELAAWTASKFDEALACEDEQARRRIYADIEGRYRGESQVMFLLHMKFYTDYHPSMHGVRINSLGWIDFKDIWRS